MTYAILASVSFFACAFFATVCESLRNFLRSRLAFYCRLHRNEVRFGQILRDDDPALQICELLKVASFVCALVLGTVARSAYWSDLAPYQIWIDLALAFVACWLCFRVLPWTLSRVAAEAVLFHCWPLINLFTITLRPLLGIARFIDKVVHRIAGKSDPRTEDLETFAEEIQSVVDEGEREGILESRSGRMIQRVMELREEDVRSVMTPRTDVSAIQVSCSLEDARRELIEAGHSRVPVVDGSMDNVIGLLYARDLLQSFVEGETEKKLSEIVRPPFYVPETTTINSLLDRMKLERLHLAIVLDEYGGVTGLVTLEDILEEIVGDIADEFDERPEELFQVIDANTLWVDAKMHLDELNEVFELTLPDDKDYDTIGGFVFSEMGRVPKQGEQIEWEQLRITVMEVTDRKVVRLELYSPVPWPIDVSSQRLPGLRSPE
ncbi:hemolysin family protein [Planctomicrobium sp. SH668]|uniref:hemolysin family protein n=1 Tax=Planctomicrobium sp. SH668 TaxID=3448126 RepID=UPI003F5B275F